MLDRIESRSRSDPPDRTRQSDPANRGFSSPSSRLTGPVNATSTLSRRALQPTLSIGPADDHLEREADQVANAIAPPAASPPPFPGATTVPSGRSSGLQRRVLSSGNSMRVAPPAVSQGLHSPGRPLDPATREAMQPHFGFDFSNVRIHDDAAAAASARSIHAQAFTLGNDIVFGEARYCPQNPAGQNLLAHELAHVVQQSMGAQPRVQRKVTFDECEALQSDVQDSHNHATSMADKTVVALRAYDGTNPPAVHDALGTHFHSSSKFIAGIVADVLKGCRDDAQDAQYECHESEDNGSTLALSMWCVPFTDIQLFKGFFKADADLRGNTLVHEWIHRYGCNFDLGYDWEPQYKTGGTVRALFNAEPYGNLVQALGTGH